MTRVKERSKLRQVIRNRKKALSVNFKKFMDSTYLDPNAAELLVNGINDLAALQRQLNAISVKTDEKKILQRVVKRINGGR